MVPLLCTAGTVNRPPFVNPTVVPMPRAQPSGGVIVQPLTSTQVLAHQRVPL